MAIQAGRTTGFVWPFPKKDPSQYKRLDQGWDLQGPYPSPVLAVAAGTVQYAGPDPHGFGNKYPILMLDQPTVYGKGVYYGHVVPTVPAGTHVTAGQAIATTAFGPQGNATVPGWLEIGWWNNGPAGNAQAMKDALLGSTVTGVGAQASGQLKFSYAQLQCLWTQAGGNSQYAPMAAAIAMAESGGDSQASHTNSNGSIDRGLWQINSSNGTGSTFDIMGNARTAVSMSNKGVNWRPWCTAYSDGACGTRGGSYLGTGAPYQKFLNPGIGPDCNFSINGTNAAANIGGDAQQIAFNCGNNAWAWVTAPGPCMGLEVASGEAGAVPKAILNGVIGGILSPIYNLLAGAAGVGGGMLFMVIGIYFMVTSTKAGQGVKRTAGKAAQIGATIAAPETLAATGGERAAARAQGTARMQIQGRQQVQEAQAERLRQRQRPTVRTTTTRTRKTKTGSTRTTTVKTQLADEANGYKQ